MNSGRREGGSKSNKNRRLIADPNPLEIKVESQLDSAGCSNSTCRARIQRERERERRCVLV